MTDNKTTEGRGFYVAAVILGTWVCAAFVAFLWKMLRGGAPAVLLTLAACGGAGGGGGAPPPSDTDSVLTIRNVDLEGIAIAWVDVTAELDGATVRIPDEPGLLTYPGEGPDSELRIHGMPPGVYDVVVQWKSAGGAFVEGDGRTFPGSVTFTFSGEDVDLDVEYRAP